MATSKFQFDRRLTRTVDSLRGTATRAQVIQRGVALLDTVVKAQRKGFKLFTVASDGSRREIVL